MDPIKAPTRWAFTSTSANQLETRYGARYKSKSRRTLVSNYKVIKGTDKGTESLLRGTENPQEKERTHTTDSDHHH